MLYPALVPALMVEAIIKGRPAVSISWEHSPNSAHLKPRLQLKGWLHGALSAKYHMVYPVRS